MIHEHRVEVLLLACARYLSVAAQAAVDANIYNEMTSARTYNPADKLLNMIDSVDTVLNELGAEIGSETATTERLKKECNERLRTKTPKERE